MTIKEAKGALDSGLIKSVCY